MAYERYLCLHGRLSIYARRKIKKCRVVLKNVTRLFSLSNEIQQRQRKAKNEKSVKSGIFFERNEIESENQNDKTNRPLVPEEPFFDLKPSNKIE
jgi:hypothetical protein